MKRLHRALFALLTFLAGAAMVADQSVTDAPFHAKADMKALTDAALRGGSPTLSSASAAFTVADAGKAIVIAGADGGVLSTTVAAVRDRRHLVLRAASATAVTTGRAAYGTDDTSAFQAALDAQFRGRQRAHHAGQQPAPVKNRLGKGETMETTIGPMAASIQSFVNDRIIAGAVLLTGAGDGPPTVETLGYADIAAQRPMQPDTLFWIASNSKQMTAAALMMLVDEGNLALDTLVSEHLPEFRGHMFVAEENDEQKVLRKPARPVTVRDLVSHTGGILPWFSDGRLNAGSLRERTLACALTPLRFEPGARWEYGNGGFEVAGRLIEVISGEALDVFLQTRLFDPLGMADTTFWPSGEQLRRLATPYAPNPDGTGLAEAALPFTDPLSDLSGSPSPGGGLFSTARDCFLFCRMIAGGGAAGGKRLLSEAAVRAMTTTQTGGLLSAPDNENGYGLGWNTTSRDHGRP